MIFLAFNFIDLQSTGYVDAQTNIFNEIKLSLSSLCRERIVLYSAQVARLPQAIQAASA